MRNTPIIANDRNVFCLLFPSLDFFPLRDPSGEAGDVLVKTVNIRSLEALGLGESEATVAFMADITFSAFLSVRKDTTYYRDDGAWPVDSRRYEDEEYEWHDGTVHEQATVAGVIKLNMAPDWSTIAGISQVVIETEDIGVDGYPVGGMDPDQHRLEEYADRDLGVDESHIGDF
jgi:hypothetical protein